MIVAPRILSAVVKGFNAGQISAFGQQTMASSWCRSEVAEQFRRIDEPLPPISMTLVVARARARTGIEKFVPIHAPA
jgi:hypothetical protein